MPKITGIYVGTKKVRPLMKWTLYKETDFKNSSYGGFRTAGWYNDASPSYIGFNTTDGYVYSTSSHSKVKLCPDLNDLALFQNAKAIKIVFDGVYIGNNSNTYANYLELIGYYTFMKRRAGLSYPTLISGEPPVVDTRYKVESTLTKEGVVTIKLDNGSVFGDQNSSLWDTWITTNAGGFFYSTASDSLQSIAGLALDQGTTSLMKDVHVYLGTM